MRGLLEVRGKQAFRDQVRREDIEVRYRHELQVIAPDVTERRLLVLPRDAPKLGIEASDDIDVALAVLMSIPVLFEPVRFPTRRAGREYLIVDRWMLSNLPVWLFDAGEPQWSTFGLKLVQNPETPIGEELPNRCTEAGSRRGSTRSRASETP